MRGVGKMDGQLTGPIRLGAVRVIKVAALLLAGAFLADTTQAQMLAFNEPGAPAFGQATMPGRGAATDTSARLRRPVVNYSTAGAPGTIILGTPNTYPYYMLRGGEC